LRNTAAAIAPPAGRGNDGAAAPAAWTRLADGEEALLDADLTAALAGRAGLWLTALGRTAAAAFRTGGTDRHLELLLGARDRLFQRKLQRVTQIGAPEHARTAMAGTAEDIAEDIGEDVGETTRTGAKSAHPCARIDTGM